MSGIMMGAAASSWSVIDPIPVSFIGDDQISPSNALGRLTIGSDGSIAVVGNSSTAGTAWHTNPATGIGASYWVRLTLTAGSNPTSGTMATWTQISSDQIWSWSRTTNGTLSGTYTLEIATDSGGSNIVGSKSFSASVSKTPA